MNYIQHTRTAHTKLLAAPTCRPHHISLYMALFHRWNNERFPVLLKVERISLMREACIGSRSTYTTALRELEAWGFLRYYPTRVSYTGNQVQMVELTGGSSPTMDQPPVHRPGASRPAEARTDCPEMGYPRLNDGLEVSQPVSPQVGYPRLNDRPEVDSPPRGVGPHVAHHSLLRKTSTTKPVQENGTADAAQKKIGVVESALPGRAGKKSVGATHASRIRAAAQQPRPTTGRSRAHTPAPEVTFSQSAIASLAAFRAAFTDTDYELADLAFYHELISNWRDKKTGEAPCRKDWVATAKRFMLNDARDNQLKLASGVQQYGTAPDSCQATAGGYRSSRFV